MNSKFITLICCAVSAFIGSSSPLSAPASSSHSSDSPLDVRVITDEADAVLAILAKKRAGQPIEDAAWQRLFTSEGYVRLKKREASLKRAFEDEQFRAFVLSDELAGRAGALEETLDRWKQADATASARLALRYLPEGAQIKVRIYPVIKPRDNSFVFELDSNPAMFLYLDPGKTGEQFENMLAHELHHVGYQRSCSDQTRALESSKLPSNVKPILELAGAFGEGVAMLAAAGGPDIHPHAVSKAEDRARWDKDVANFNEDLKKVEKFFLDILEKRLTKEDDVRQAAFSFFGVQGPWYTVGWKMSVMIEKAYGRARLIEMLCDPRQLLVAYNDAAAKYNRKAKEPLAVWSKQLIEAISKADYRN